MSARGGNAAAVLTGRDDAFEVQVLDGVVLDVEGGALHRGVEGWPLGDRPAREHAVDLEAQVVVQAPGAVALHD